MPTVRISGLEIGYRAAGEGPPLLLLHGAASDGRDWRPQLEGLAEDLSVVAWDEPGAGGSSDPPAAFGLDSFAHVLADFIAALDLAPAHVGGLSWGGVLALELYRLHPESVGTLILADTYAGWKGSLPAEEVEARISGVRRALDVPPGEFVAHVPGLFADQPQPDVVAEMERIMADVRPDSMRRTMELVAECDLSDLLPRISVPTLLIWGDQDARSPVEVVGRQFQDAVPGAELALIPGAGHLSNLEQPAHFNRAVRDFCRAHPLSR